MVVRLLQTLILGFFCAQTCAASVTAYVDRNPVSANESFILTFDVKGKLDAEPDFTPYAALEVDQRIFNAQTALDPFDETFDWKALEESPEIDNVQDMMDDSKEQDADRLEKREN